MFNSTAINVVIGLVFIYSLYSLLVTTLNEIAASFFNLRAKTLEKGIRRMLTDLDDPSNRIVAQFYQQPVIKYLGESNSKKPSYMSSNSFSSALVHLCKDLSTGSADLEEQLHNGIQEIKKVNPETGKYLEILYQEADGKVAHFEQLAENWFNETMDRATGWYKKQTQKITLLVAFTVALSFNVDTIQIVKNLSYNPQQAEQLASIADQYLKTKQNSSQPENREADEQLQASLQQAQLMLADQRELQEANAVLGLGWQGISGINILYSVFGCMLTALAISLGAPFWFDLLSKMMQLRGSKKTESAQNKKG
jgi:hypothetical protein